MRLPMKYIAMLVMVALVAVFAYQTYWLVGLYHTMRHQMEQDIVEALRSADYDEMMIRTELLKSTGDNQGYAALATSVNGQIETTTVTKTTSDTINAEGKKEKKTTITTSYSQSDTLSVRSPNDEENGDSLLTSNYQNTVSRLSVYFQRAYHLTIDALMPPDYERLDSLLTEYLAGIGIEAPHRLLILQQVDSIHTDTLHIVTHGNLLPNEADLYFDNYFDPTTNRLERIELPNLQGVLFGQMAGILATSIVILLVLGFAFWYLIRTLLRLRTIEEMKSDFTNNITHELKTPIAVAYAANDALLNFGKDTDMEKRSRYLGIVGEQLSHLSGMVEQILSLSMERRQTFHLDIEPVNVSELLQPIIEQQKMKADKPVSITVKITPNDLTLQADRTHLGNIIGNLIDNAIKYSRDKAEVSIFIDKRTIRMSDRGIGIAPDKLPHIFEKFYRVPTGNVHDVKGYGLGLFYVKTMVEKHGWDIQVESRPEEGTTFTITL